MGLLGGPVRAMHAVGVQARTTAGLLDGRAGGCVYVQACRAGAERSLQVRRSGPLACSQWEERQQAEGCHSHRQQPCQPAAVAVLGASHVWKLRRAQILHSMRASGCSLEENECACLHVCSAWPACVLGCGPHTGRMDGWTRTQVGMQALGVGTSAMQRALSRRCQRQAYLTT